MDALLEEIARRVQLLLDQGKTDQAKFVAARMAAVREELSLALVMLKANT